MSADCLVRSKTHQLIRGSPKVQAISVCRKVAQPAFALYCFGSIAQRKAKRYETQDFGNFGHYFIAILEGCSEYGLLKSVVLNNIDMIKFCIHAACAVFESTTTRSLLNIYHQSLFL